MTESLADGFEPVSFEQWSEAATRGDENLALMTLLENGVEAKWLYTPEDAIAPDPAGLPGQAPFTRGTRAGRHWQIRQEQTQPDRGRANAEILEDLNGGVTEITLRFDRAAREGLAPGTDGFSAARGIDGIAISNLDQLGEVLDGVYLDMAGVALEAGADDFLVKPPREHEFLARVHALGRRGGAMVSRDIVMGPYRVDLARSVIERDSNPVNLTRREYELALFLFRNPGKVVSRAHILESVWGRSSEVTTRTIDTHVSRLRNVLGLSSANGVRLTPIYGYGYRLEAVAPASG